jgi:hypothetical protein
MTDKMRDAFWEEHAAAMGDGAENWVLIEQNEGFA